MTEAKLVLRFPCDKPLKKDEKNRLINDLISSFKAFGISDAKLADSYYVTGRAMPEMMIYALVFLTALANIATITRAIRDFLKGHNEIKEVHLKTESLELTIKANMSDEDIIKLVKKGKEIIETEKGK